MAASDRNISSSSTLSIFGQFINNYILRRWSDSLFLYPVKILSHATERLLMSDQDKEDIKKYRLGPYALNEIVGKMVQAQFKDQFSQGDFWYTVNSKKHKKTFVVFHMCKDAEALSNEPNLVFFFTMLEKYCQSNKVDPNTTFIIPLGLVLLFCSPSEQFRSLNFLKRKHATLLEINLTEQKIILHDSQDKSRSFLYPDKIKKFIGKISELFNVTFTEEIRGYDKQKDSFSCEYYVMRYIDYILTTGSSDDCKDLIVEIKKNYTDKTAYFESRCESLDDRIDEIPPDPYLYNDIEDEFTLMLHPEDEKKQMAQEWVLSKCDENISSTPSPVIDVDLSEPLKVAEPLCNDFKKMPSGSHLY